MRNVRAIALLLIGALALIAEWIPGLSAASVVVMFEIHRARRYEWVIALVGALCVLPFVSSLQIHLYDYDAAAGIAARAAAFVLVFVTCVRTLPFGTTNEHAEGWAPALATSAIAAVAVVAGVVLTGLEPLDAVRGPYALAVLSGLMAVLPGVNVCSAVSFDAVCAAGPWSGLVPLWIVAAAIACAAVWVLRELGEGEPRAQAALLWGLMASGLWRLWPWQWLTSYTLSVDGRIFAPISRPQWPADHALSTGLSPQWLAVAIGVAIGILLACGLRGILAITAPERDARP